MFNQILLPLQSEATRRTVRVNTKSLELKEVGNIGVLETVTAIGNGIVISTVKITEAKTVTASVIPVAVAAATIGAVAAAITSKIVQFLPVLIT